MYCDCLLGGVEFCFCFVLFFYKQQRVGVGRVQNKTCLHLHLAVIWLLLVTGPVTSLWLKIIDRFYTVKEDTHTCTHRQDTTWPLRRSLLGVQRHKVLLDVGFGYSRNISPCLSFQPENKLLLHSGSHHSILLVSPSLIALGFRATEPPEKCSAGDQRCCLHLNVFN